MANGSIGTSGALSFGKSKWCIRRIAAYLFNGLATCFAVPPPGATNR